MLVPDVSPSSRVKSLFLVLLLLISGTVIFASWKAPYLANHTFFSVASSLDQKSNQVEAEIVTITPTGFEPATIRRPQGRFLLAVDNRSGLSEVPLYWERETGTRLNSTPTRTGKLRWRDIIDFPPGTYILRAANDDSWRCRITLAPQ